MKSISPIICLRLSESSSPPRRTVRTRRNLFGLLCVLRVLCGGEFDFSMHSIQSSPPDGVEIVPERHLGGLPLHVSRSHGCRSEDFPFVYTIEGAHLDPAHDPGGASRAPTSV